MLHCVLHCGRGPGPPIPQEAIGVMWFTPLILVFVSGINHPFGIEERILIKKVGEMLEDANKECI